MVGLLDNAICSRSARVSGCCWPAIAATASGVSIFVGDGKMGCGSCSRGESSASAGTIAAQGIMSEVFGADAVTFARACGSGGGAIGYARQPMATTSTEMIPRERMNPSSYYLGAKKNHALALSASDGFGHLVAGAKG